jgi:hypothetical protein
VEKHKAYNSGILEFDCYMEGIHLIHTTFEKIKYMVNDKEFHNIIESIIGPEELLGS